jgi:hypothetical protein
VYGEFPPPKKVKGAPIERSMLREQNKPTAQLGLRSEMQQTLMLIFWAVLICCVVIGSLAPAASPLMVAIGRLHINDKVQHFCAYLALSSLPVIGFREPPAQTVKIRSDRCRRMTPNNAAPTSARRRPCSVGSR